MKIAYFVFADLPHSSPALHFTLCGLDCISVCNTLEDETLLKTFGTTVLNVLICWYHPCNGQAVSLPIHLCTCRTGGCLSSENFTLWPPSWEDLQLSAQMKKNRGERRKPHGETGFEVMVLDM